MKYSFLTLTAIVLVSCSNTSPPPPLYYNEDTGELTKSPKSHYNPRAQEIEDYKDFGPTPGQMKQQLENQGNWPRNFTNYH